MIGRLRAYLATFRGFEPDARGFLVVTAALGGATSLWWIDFNLYLAALGFSRAFIGLSATAAGIASTLVAYPASALSDRIGRRLVMLGCLALGVAALAGLLATSAAVAIIACAAAWSAGYTAFSVVQSPFMVEHSRPAQRSQLFALQFAITTATNAGAAALGGIVAGAIAGAIGLPAGGPGVYRVILVLMIGLLVIGAALILRIGDDRPIRRPSPERLAGEPARFPPDPGSPRRRRGLLSLARLGITIRDRAAFGRLLLPGFIIAIGAGQVIPFLNLFVQRRFGLDLAALNAVFALTSLGTVAAALVQPAIAARLGRIASVVAVQGASIPFLVVLGFSPVLWTVVAAMTIRTSLMNAGNPIFIAFAMDQVSPTERATLSATMSLLWSLGWVIGGPWYAFLQATLGFDAGYAVSFATIIVLYTLATWLYWYWFGASGRSRRPGSTADRLAA
jgi:MFS family permease